MEEPSQEPHRHHDQDAQHSARNLDFNLPLLSTRRHGRWDDVEQLSCTTAANSINLPHHRIPFCWERAPGRPKRPVNDADQDYTPRLRLPPCRWHPAATETNQVVDSRNDAEDQDPGCDADVDEDEDEGDYYNNYSNAYMDALSLTEAIDIAQRGDDGGEFRRRERFSVSSSRNANDAAGGAGSPNFMMERFLPDATALAASSVLYATNKMLPFYDAAGDVEERYGRLAQDSYAPAEDSSVVSQKGCGLDVLFPWRTKHKLCNAKSPVRQVVLPSPAQPPRLSAKQKRDHRSSDKACGDVILSRHV